MSQSFYLSWARALLVFLFLSYIVKAKGDHGSTMTDSFKGLRSINVSWGEDISIVFPSFWCAFLMFNEFLYSECIIQIKVRETN